MPHRTADLTPEERARRVAALLATGLLRLGSALSPPDPTSVQLPDLSSTDPEVIDNGGKFFAFVNPSLTYAQAYVDIAECRSFLPTGTFRQLPSFIPWEEPSVRPPVVYNPSGLAAGILVSIIMPKVERGQRNNKLRRCMGPSSESSASGSCNARRPGVFGELTFSTK